jgi:hypothetical protein
MRLVVAILISGLMLAGCSTGITVKDREVIPGKIQTWQTFAWKADLVVVDDQNFNQTNKSIRQAVGSRLTELGYRETSRDQADFLLTHSIFAHFEREKLSKREERAIRDEEILNPGSHRGEENIVHQQGEGFLYLAVTDKNDKLVWDGRVESVLNYRGQGAKVVTRAVNQLLANFPKKTQ